MDDLTYDYITNTNRLKAVFDNVSYGSNYPTDIDHQMNYPNYSYDAIGNLIADVAEGINNITWNVYGKIKSIQKTNGNLITYTYDASGNRISKKAQLSGGTKTTIYVRDASGNVMGIYEGNGQALEQNEVHLYGSSRLGILNKLTEATTNITLDAGFGTAKMSTFTRGEKLFELSNHLGNVLVTISDKKIGVDANTDGIIDYYNADIVTASDYYPFGMDMPGRRYTNGSGYRYGFNGKENDKNIGEGIQDYGMRIYDQRLGRFFSVDPITKKYPELTPYQFASNRCIQGIDLDGLEVFLVTGNAGAFFAFGGLEYNAGIAFSKDGIALVAGATFQAGIGMEIGATITGTLYPTMKNLEDVDGVEGSFAGISASGAYLTKYEVGVSVSNDSWGGTFGVGVGLGAHISGDFNGPSAIKVIKWSEIFSFISSNTEESKKVQAILNIGNGKNQNSIQIVKDYLSNLATSFKNKRISDLRVENKNNTTVISDANTWLDDYKKSNWLYRLYAKIDKVKIDKIKQAAEKKIKTNAAEISLLEKTEIKID